MPITDQFKHVVVALFWEAIDLKKLGKIPRADAAIEIAKSNLAESKFIKPMKKGDDLETMIETSKGSASSRAKRLDPKHHQKLRKFEEILVLYREAVAKKIGKPVRGGTQ